MRSKLLQNWVPPPNELRFLIIIILVLGLFFRFVNLDRKIYWMDETYTSLRISGYTESEVAQQLLEGQVISLQDLHRYQHINPEKNIIDTVKGLASEEPQLAPPLFHFSAFLGTNIWRFSRSNPQFFCFSECAGVSLHLLAMFRII